MTLGQTTLTILNRQRDMVRTLPTLFDILDGDGFYISCQQGLHRTDIVLALYYFFAIREPCRKWSVTACTAHSVAMTSCVAYSPWRLSNLQPSLSTIDTNIRVAEGEADARPPGMRFSLFTINNLTNGQLSNSKLRGGEC